MDEPDLPIKLGPCSNGEVPPEAVTAVVRETVRRARLDADATARRLGMDRRRFLRTTMGSAVTLLTLAACNRDSGGTGGTFAVPTSATTEPDAARDVLGGGVDPVVDVQTHLLEYDRSRPLGERFFGAGFPQADCGADDPRDCFTTDVWQDLVFERSDTSLAVLSAIPVVGDVDPLSIEVMEAARRQVAETCTDDARVLIQGHAVPNVGAFGAAREAMLAIAEGHDIAAWKTYTHAGPGFRLDDADPAGAPVGQAFLDTVRDSGVPIVAVHKGLSGNDPWASPADIGPAAAANPDLTFLVYHSGYESREGPRQVGGGGIDRLLDSLDDAGIGPGGNVYAELGSTWRRAMSDVDDAAHVLGKLLAALGEDRILWGTDSLWYGSPQDQIEAFRAFQISTEFQDRHGYPPLSDAAKAKILGANALALHGIDPVSISCRPAAEVEDARMHGAPDRLLGPRTTEQAARLFRAEHPWFG